MSEPKGALYFWKDMPHVTGWFTVGDEHYELVGVRRSDIKVDLKGRKIEPDQQRDMFNDRSGDGAS